MAIRLRTAMHQTLPKKIRAPLRPSRGRGQFL